ncbi:hypothetical protein [Amycolatopsis sp. NPDC051372]|uniref:hypothetical protein n=1 Tax=Amycolatopsis sp. NPDC051372 TaxID=3155669 RepID=UPI003437536C
MALGDGWITAPQLAPGQLAHIHTAAPTHLTVDCRGAGRSAAEHVEISATAAALISDEL